MNEDLIDKVARALATNENNLYWKWDFPEGHKSTTEKWYRKRAIDEITIFELILEYKKNE